MYSVITTAIHHGLHAVPVNVEADVSEGMPCFDMVGFLSSEVKEAKERVRTALKNCGYPLPAKRITINLTPANIRKSGTGCDLPLAAAVLASLGHIDGKLLKDYLVLGEISLNGQILPVGGVLSAAILAKELGCDGIIVPLENAKEAAILSDLDVIPVPDLPTFLQYMWDGFPAPFSKQAQTDLWKTNYSVDFSDLYGQPLVRRACEIAVSGMHNLLMIGPPGSGKTMTAKRIPTILPELSREEKLELSQIYSIGNQLDDVRIIRNERPFRAPHHTTTPVAIAGGGRVPRPGEISLAHHGVLFLDELPEFPPAALEVLREPLEEKQIHIARQNGSVTYPADFILVASMNPCPCGYYPDRNRCSCTPYMIHRYVNHVSQALLDRIDLCVETKELSFTEMKQNDMPEASEEIRARVERVHALQRERYRDRVYRFNAQIPNADMDGFCALDAECESFMQEKFEEYHLSARTYNQIRKTSRTIADMEGATNIGKRHLEEALCFRSPNKKYWR